MSMLTGENGIITKSNEAKYKTEVGNDKDILQLAYLNALSKNKSQIEKNNLKESINSYGKNVDVLIDNNSFIILDNDKTYRLSNDGNIDGPINLTLTHDNFPGDITKSKDGTNLSGDENQPYEIWCIEDLIEWSNNYSNYLDNHIILCRDLDFKSELYYENADTTSYGDYNNDGTVSTLIEELSSGSGFQPIELYKGIFNGNNFELKNIYIYSDKSYVGLFSTINNGSIKNLSISGEITSTCLGDANRISTASIAARIVDGSTLYNCTNKCNIYATQSSQACGIVGQMR